MPEAGEPREEEEEEEEAWWPWPWLQLRKQEAMGKEASNLKVLQGKLYSAR
mgnify:CR=1